MHQMHEALKKAGLVNDKSKFVKDYQKRPMTLKDKVLLRKIRQSISITK